MPPTPPTLCLSITPATRAATSTHPSAMVSLSASQSNIPLKSSVFVRTDTEVKFISRGSKVNVSKS